MKRLVLICVLIMLPLQISWAAIGSYCGHELGQAAQHIGHHDHEHEQAADEQPSKGTLGMSDSDCGYCHHVSASLIASNLPVLAVAVDSTKVEFQLQRYISPYSAGPSRPNWPLSAG